MKFLNLFLYCGVSPQESNPALWRSEKQVRFSATSMHFPFEFIYVGAKQCPTIDKKGQYRLFLFLEFFPEKSNWNSAVKQTAQHPCFFLSHLYASLKRKIPVLLKYFGAKILAITDNFKF